jgi:8-oxo-dGTP diphosphatase
MKIIPVTCALIIQEGKVLAAQRSASMDLPGKWEFPGGKVEEREDPKTCLIREIREELAMDVDIHADLPPADFQYPTKAIRLIPFLATWKSGDIRLLEHVQVVWIGREELFSLDWAAADLPIVHYLYDNWGELILSKKAEGNGGIY